MLSAFCCKLAFALNSFQPGNVAAYHTDGGRFFQLANRFAKSHIGQRIFASLDLIL